MNVGFEEGKGFALKKEKITCIDNQKLIEPLHDLRMKEVTYQQDFIIIPKL
jgi:hypothetical protein